MTTIVKQDIRIKLGDSFLTYAISVIQDRAIPTVEDGLKPVQRRIIYSIYDLGLISSKPHKKSARIVGEVLGKYHAHGDASIYSAMVNLVQDFKMRYPIVDGHGNYGSLDQDPPAAMRYTEARLTKYAEYMLRDIDKNVVEFKDNFDNTLKEPTVLPTMLPNILLNGTSGIAVGMATSLLPHNLNEVIDGLIALTKNRDMSLENMLKHIKGPDFPLGGIIYIEDIFQLYSTGIGSIKIRSKLHLEGNNIIVTELPYQIDKSTILKQVAVIAQEKKIEGINNLRDESNKEGIRIVIETDNRYDLSGIINSLYSKTKLQSSASMRNLVLVNKVPRTLGLLEMLNIFLDFRKKVITVRLKNEYKQLETRLTILDAIIIALKYIEKIVVIIKQSKNSSEACLVLSEKFKLSRDQARSILDMKLSRLLRMEADSCKEETKQVKERIAEIQILLKDKDKFDSLLIEELQHVKKALGDKRRSKIVDSFEDTNLKEIKEKDFTIFLTAKGKIGKVSRLSKFKSDIGIFKDTFNNSDKLLLISNFGNAFILSTGNIIDTHNVSDYILLQDKEKIIYINRYVNQNLYIVSKRGSIAHIKTKDKDFCAMRLDSDRDRVVKVFDSVKPINLLLFTRNGFGLKMGTHDLRLASSGVKGINAMNVNNDFVKDVIIIEDNKKFVYVTKNGYVKVMNGNDIPLQGRGGKGVIILRITNDTGKVYKAFNYGDSINYLVDDKIEVLDYKDIEETKRASNISKVVQSFSYMVVA